MKRTRCAFGLLLAAGLLWAGVCGASERAGTVTFAIDVNAPAATKIVKLWFPYPTSGRDQTISSLNFSGNYSSFSLAREPLSGALYLDTEWIGPMKKRMPAVTFDARSRECRVRTLAESRARIPTGWIPVDPADVMKGMVEKRLDPAAARRCRDYYFGAVAGDRIVLERGGRGLAFAEGNVHKVNYFMYPYAEVDGRPLDYCRPKPFRHDIHFREG